MQYRTVPVQIKFTLRYCKGCHIRSMSYNRIHKSEYCTTQSVTSVCGLLLRALHRIYNSTVKIYLLSSYQYNNLEIYFVILVAKMSLNCATMLPDPKLLKMGRKKKFSCE